ncbi:hypothetical protein IW262DRAFT_1296917 [Armillaria fumosa]|nr:hypothetical protein IW262DRAFT_1296917 [Armillaria fumosa]
MSSGTFTKAADAPFKRLLTCQWRPFFRCLPVRVVPYSFTVLCWTLTSYDWSNFSKSIKIILFSVYTYSRGAGCWGCTTRIPAWTMQNFCQQSYSVYNSYPTKREATFRCGNRTNFWASANIKGIVGVKISPQGGLQTNNRARSAYVSQSTK